MITAEDLLKPVTPLYLWDVVPIRPATYKRTNTLYSGLRDRLLEVLPDRATHVRKIAALVLPPDRLGSSEVKRVNIELSRMARNGMAYALGKGFYRRVRT